MILSGKNEENESMKKAKFMPENQVFGQAGGVPEAMEKVPEVYGRLKK